MLNFPLCKRLAIILVCLAGLWISFPNLFYSQVERSNDARDAIAAGREADPADITWPEFLANGLVNLGLDLRGGAHVLAEVATADVEAERLEGLWPLVRDELRDELGEGEDLNITVTAASNGEDGLAGVANGGEFDLVVSDVVMPGMDGPAMARAIRKVRPELPFLFMSGYAEEQLRSEIDMENMHFLAKPFNVQQIGDKVAMVMTSRRG